MTFGDTSLTHITLSPDPEGWEIRIYNEMGEYWPARLSTGEMMQAVALVMDAESARRFGRKEGVSLGAPTGSLCPECGEPQSQCPSGLICPNGHGY